MSKVYPMGGRLYDVTTKSLNQAVKRNSKRFPDDFAFQLTAAEAAGLRSQDIDSQKDILNRSQIVTGSQKHRDRRFTGRNTIPFEPGNLGDASDVIAGVDDGVVHSISSIICFEVYRALSPYHRSFVRVYLRSSAINVLHFDRLR